MAKGSDQQTAGKVELTNASWATARRGRFEVYEDRVEMGDWVIRYDEVSEAVVYRIPYLFVFAYSVIELNARGRTWQFGFNPWAKPGDRLGVEVRREDVAVPLWRELARLALYGVLVYLFVSAILDGG